MCGEHAAADLHAALFHGSSPRVRGTQQRGDFGSHVNRFIPACAGNTRDTAKSLGYVSVHPRVCGEHGVSQRTRRLGSGSSPRVWGTRYAIAIKTVISRFIPACAGNTEPSAAARMVVSGSSPRVRGTQRPGFRRGQQRRFIPACAGNTPAAPRRPPSPTVHPRVCGEHACGTPRPSASTGSSPRVRGTPEPGAVRWRAERFIPACAGNTRTARAQVRLWTVHPRVCGEHPGDVWHAVFVGGSSPRVRGTLGLKSGITDTRRFIPACAGNTAPTTRSSPPRPVHPRVCGEHAGDGVAPNISGGSSPRVRGTPQGHGQASAGGRFIPACAGNTRALILNDQLVQGSSPRVRGTLRHLTPRA